LNFIEPCGADKSVGAACSRDSGTHRGYKPLPQKRSFQSFTDIVSGPVYAKVDGRRLAFPKEGRLCADGS
jgi:hypothetical protein